MIEKIYQTKLGDIHYWISYEGEHKSPQLVFLPGLTADHRLFEKQTEYFEGKYPHKPDEINKLIKKFAEELL